METLLLLFRGPPQMIIITISFRAQLQNNPSLPPRASSLPLHHSRSPASPEHGGTQTDCPRASTRAAHVPQIRRQPFSSRRYPGLTDWILNRACPFGVTCNKTSLILALTLHLEERQARGTPGPSLPFVPHPFVLSPSSLLLLRHWVNRRLFS